METETQALEAWRGNILWAIRGEKVLNLEEGVDFRICVHAQPPFHVLEVAGGAIILDSVGINTVWPMRPGAVIWTYIEDAEMVLESINDE